MIDVGQIIRGAVRKLRQRPLASAATEHSALLDRCQITIENRSAALRYMYSIQSKKGATFLSSSEQQMYCSVDGLKLCVETEEDLYILKEIFADRVYDLALPSPAIVIDIGMNVAFASLFFAQKDQVEVVWAFEPFRQTYEQGLRNIALNPSVAPKIRAYSYGVSASAYSAELDYSYYWKGRAGIGNRDREIHPDRQLSTQQVHFEQATQILERVMSESRGHSIVVKMDCEGGEYEIMGDWARSGKLSNVAALMLEWHHGGAANLVQALTESGFISFSLLPFPTSETGMIYAVRRT